MSTSPFGDRDSEVMRAYNELGRALARGEPFAEMVRLADQFGERFISIFDADGNRAAVRQVRRLVAHAHVDAALSSGLPLDACEVLIARLLAEGAGGPLALTGKVEHWARYCEQQGDLTRALHYLRPLVEDLEDEHARTGDTSIAECLESARRALARLQAGGS